MNFLQQSFQSAVTFAHKNKALCQACLVVAFSGLIVTAESGCTAAAKKARALAKANQSFDAGEYEKAEIEYKNVLQIQPFEPDAMSRLGIIYFEEGRPFHANYFLTKAKELQPNNVDARLRLGMHLMSTGQINEARVEALFVLERRPQDEQAPLLLAETARQPKEIEESRQRLQKLASPGSTPVLLALGLLDLRQGKLKEAEANVQRALAQTPGSSAAKGALGSLYLAQKDVAKAEKAFAEAATLAPVRSAQRMRYAEFCLQTGKVPLAKEQVTEITKKAPDYVPAWRVLANIAINDKKPDEALAALDKILALDPVSLDARLMHARTNYDKGEKEKAITELVSLASLYTKSPEPHYQLGVYYYAMGEVEKAATSLQTVLTLAPDRTTAIFLLAEINVRRRQFGPAIIALKQLVAKQPKMIPAYMLLGQAYRGQGNLDDALAVYRNVEKSFPPDPQYQFLIGSIMVQRREKEPARQAFIKSLEVDPNYLQSIEQLVNIELYDKQFAAAQKRVEQLIAKFPKAGEPQLLLAKVAFAQSDTKQAEAALLRAIELSPESPAGYLTLARLYVSNNQQAKAMKDLELLVAKNPKSLEALTLIAVISEQQKDYTRARDTYEKILALNPKVTIALNNLAYLYSEHLNEIDKAYGLAQRARDLAAGDPNIADTLGWIAFKKRLYPRAQVLLAESAEKLPSSADVHYHLGMTHYFLGDEGPARVALEKALTLNADFPGSADAKQALAILAMNPKTDGAKSLAALEKIVAERPDPVALVRLGLIYEQNGSADKAFAAFESARKASPSNVTAALGMARIHLARKEPAKAFELAKAVRVLAPNDPEVAHSAGRIAFVSGNHAWASSLLEESARKQPDDPEVLFDYAESAFSMGRTTEAESAMRKAIDKRVGSTRLVSANGFVEMLSVAANPSQPAAATSVDRALKSAPNDGTALLASASLQEQKGDLGGARKSYEKILELYPEMTQAKKRLVVLYAKGSEADVKAAAALVTKVRETYPKDAEVAKAIGLVYFKQGNHSRAVALLQESAVSRTTDPEVVFYLGLSQQKLNQRTEAKASLQKALGLQLDAALAAEARRALAELK